MSTSVVIIGAGGFGREALDVLQAINNRSSVYSLNLLGVVDSAPSDLNLGRLAARGIPWLGSVDTWLGSESTAEYVVAIGSPGTRALLDERIRSAGRNAATLVHPEAHIGSMVTIGPGSVICAGAHLSTNITLGRSVHVNPNATIGHDTKLGDWVSVNPGAIISGDVTVAAGVLVGAGAVVLQGVNIGEGAVVGASACVVRNVPPAATVKGVPAR